MTAFESQEAWEIRLQLQRELGGAFSEPFWRRVYKNAVRDYIQDPSQEFWSEVVDVAADLFDFQQEVVADRESREGGGSQQQGAVIGAGAQEQRGAYEDSSLELHSSQPPKLTEEESLRAEVFEEYLAKVAEGDYYVVRFRRRELGNRLLNAEQAHKYIRSPAAQALPRAWFDAKGIPIEDHDAKLVDYEQGTQESHFIVDHATITVRWPDNLAGMTNKVRSQFDGDRRFRMLTFRNEDRKAESIHVWRGSTLGELQEAASQLAKRFPWQEAQATWYLLTGEPQAVPPVRMQYKWDHVKAVHRFVDRNLEPNLEPVYFAHGAITLSVAPWVSAKTFRGVHRDMQQRMLKQRESHQLETKTLTLLRFVIDKENPVMLTRSRRRKVGGELQKAWDKQHPHWAYGKYQQPTSLFWRDYDRAEGLVAPSVGTETRTLGSHEPTKNSS